MRSSLYRFVYIVKGVKDIGDGLRQRMKVCDFENKNLRIKLGDEGERRLVIYK